MSNFLERKNLNNAFLVVLSSLFAILCVEGSYYIYRLFDKAKVSHFVWPPNLVRKFKPDESLYPGIFGQSLVRTNSYGIRGDEFSSDDDFRILTIGGSTTECLYLDQNEAWPALLQDHLNAFSSSSNKSSVRAEKYWVGNLGAGGIYSTDHVLQMHFLLPQYPKIDLIIVLMGANDLQRYLAHEFRNPILPVDKSNPTEYQLGRAFPFQNTKEMLWYQKLVLWRVKEIINIFNRPSDFEQTYDGDRIRYWRQRRFSSKKVAKEAPDLENGLSNFVYNMVEMSDIAHKVGAELVFLTQPSLWKEGLSEQEEALLWSGWIGKKDGENIKGYYSTRVLRDTMNVYNRTLLQKCDALELKCYDLAGAIQKTTENFYDDMHFTEQGARNVSALLRDYLVSEGLVGSRLSSQSR